MARVLVVDDSPSVVSWLAVELTALGHEVEATDNGHEALLLMELDPPDLVVLDIEMPLMNGFDVLRKMRRKPRLGHLKVVLLTGRETDANRARGYRLGARHFLTKPVDAEELSQAVVDAIAA